MDNVEVIQLPYKTVRMSVEIEIRAEKSFRRFDAHIGISAAIAGTPLSRFRLAALGSRYVASVLTKYELACPDLSWVTARWDLSESQAARI